MFHDHIVKMWTVCTQRNASQTSSRQRRTSRRFAPELSRNSLEIRMVPSTMLVTPGGDPPAPEVQEVPSQEP
jgi:hypothetical protein